MAALEFIGATAGGAAEGLEDVLRRRFLEIQQRNQQRQFEVEQERLRQQDAFRRQQEVEGQRRWDATNARLVAADARDKARDDATAAARGERDAFLGMLQNNPAEFHKMPLVGRLALAHRHGVSMGEHTAETPDEHAAHLKRDDEADFSDFQRRARFTAGAQESAAEAREGRAEARQLARLRADNPREPMGAERYIVSLASKHGNFDAAARELEDYINGSGTQAHPNMSAVWARETLRRAFARPSGESDLDRVAAAVGGGGSVRAAAPGGGRGAAPAGVGTAQTYRWPDGTVRAYPPGSDAQPRPTRQAGTPPAARSSQGGDDAQVRANARQLLRQALGRDVSDEDVSKFLAVPKNRAAAGGR